MEMKENYYSKSLNASRLLDVYQTGIDRVRRYLEAEIEFVKRHLDGVERVLELGAGYGRIMRELAPFAASIVGVEFSKDSVLFGNEYLAPFHNCSFQTLDAHLIDFDSEFDVVLCLQNGLSAMKGDPRNLVERSIRALARGGKPSSALIVPNSGIIAWNGSKSSPTRACLGRSTGRTRKTAG